MAPLLVLFPMVEYPFSSAATEALVDCSTERLRRLHPISTPKDDTSESALSRAHEILADRCIFLLSQSKWAEFQAALDAPTRDNPRMQRFLTEPGFFDDDASERRS